MRRLLGATALLALALVLGVAAAPALEGDDRRGGTFTVATAVPPAPATTAPPRARDPEPVPPRANELVASFTSRYTPGEPRVTNIRRAAELLDGTTLRAGETFSMNDALGERTTDRGFVAAPMILGGRLVESVGGGISQVATSLYNAAFFAGLELVEHTPHSFYIDRYPMGREATVSWGGPELVFRNDWPAALTMRLTTTGDAITVRFFSARLGRRVETETAEPQLLTNGGFTVEYTRRVYRFGRLIRDEVFEAAYRPHP